MSFLTGMASLLLLHVLTVLPVACHPPPPDHRSCGLAA
jgi:hypothetical protein